MLRSIKTQKKNEANIQPSCQTSLVNKGFLIQPNNVSIRQKSRTTRLLQEPGKRSNSVCRKITQAHQNTGFASHCLRALLAV